MHSNTKPTLSARQVLKTVTEWEFDFKDNHPKSQKQAKLIPFFTPNTRKFSEQKEYKIDLLKRKLTEKQLAFNLSIRKDSSSSTKSVLGKTLFGRTFQTNNHSPDKGHFNFRSQNVFKIKTVKQKSHKAIQLVKKDIEPEVEVNHEMDQYRDLKPFVPHYITCKFIFPIVEHATMRMIYRNESPVLVISGGLGNGINSEIICCNLVRKSIDNTHFTTYNDTAHYGHTAETYGKYEVVLFGGDHNFWKPNNRIDLGKQPSIQCNLTSINHRFKTIAELRSESSKRPKLRKFHASCLFDSNYLILFGGMKMNYKFMTDIWIYDFEDNQWHEFEINMEVTKFLEYGIAHHKLVVMSPNITKLSPIEIKDPKKKTLGQTIDSNTKSIYIFKSHKKKILLDIFLFGGLNEENQVIDNKLWQLGMKNRKFYFREVTTAGGYEPEARFSHSMDASPSTRQLIVVGGQNKHNLFLSDISIFSFTTKSWSRHYLNDDSMTNGIAGHASECFENCLFIFGGINQEGFRNSDLMYFTFAKRDPK